MNEFGWGDDSKEMKPYSYEHKSRGVTMGGGLGFATGVLIAAKFLGSLFFTLIVGAICAALGALLGGFLGALKDKRQDRKKGL